MFYPVHMLNDRKVWIVFQSAYLKSLKLIFDRFNITITRNTIVIDINFKRLTFKNLTKVLLILTMFIQRADNLTKLIGTTIILTFANREHKVQ